MADRSNWTDVEVAGAVLVLTDAQRRALREVSTLWAHGNTVNALQRNGLLDNLGLRLTPFGEAVRHRLLETEHD